MNILITNDDGINAVGIKKLAASLQQMGKVTVIAPETEMSATGHAITMHQPLRVKRMKEYTNDIEAWIVNGTPSDCVKIGVESIMKEKPDLIVSGINNGPNLGTDVIYSGTVSAAIEGAIHNIPSIALSVAGRKTNLNYEGAAFYSCKLVNMVLKNNQNNSLIVNINVPSLEKEEIQGVRITELGIRKYSNSYEKRIDPMGRNYYWLSGKLMELENSHNSDVRAIEDRYISVTPLHYDLTDYDHIDELKKWDVNW